MKHLGRKCILMAKSRVVLILQQHQFVKTFADAQLREINSNESKLFEMKRKTGK
jgi:hypothetical protein